MNIPAAQFAALIARHQAGDYPGLARLAGEATRRHAQDARGWQLAGVAQLAMGKPALALPRLLRAKVLAPSEASIWDNLGLTLDALGDAGAADACFREATRLRPDNPGTWANWSQHALKAGRAGDAEAYARAALDIDPRLPGAHLNLGNALLSLRRHEAAEACYRQALALAPDWPEAELSLGGLYKQSGRLDDAARLFEALAARHDDWRVLSNLGRVYSDLGDTGAACAAYARAVAANPEAHGAHSSLLFLRLHDDTVAADSLFAEHKRYGASVEAPFRDTWGGHANRRDPERRLRIGFVSGDLRQHAVAYFIEPLLSAFERTALALYVYANHPGEDEVMRRLRAQVEVWRPVHGIDDARLAARIRADAIDILIDLSGHTAYNRLPVFARKPAPIQVSWLGYPATTGLSAIDYRPIYSLAAQGAPLDGQFTEKLVLLRHALPFQAVPDAPATRPPPVLTRGYITLASLNRPSKIGARALSIWSDILRALPDARLLLGAVGDAAGADMLRRRCAERGIDPARLDIRPRLPLMDYLALHGEIDILLDTLPYTGGTTTSHGLWMGVPTLTLAGSSLRQRQGAAFLAKAGLSDWIAADEDDYRAKAIAFAGDPAGLAALRADLRPRLARDAASDAARIARCMERALREMWRRYCAGQAPAAFEVAE